MLLSSGAMPAIAASLPVDPALTNPDGATLSASGIVLDDDRNDDLLVGPSPLPTPTDSKPGRASEAASRPGAYCPIGGCQSPPPSRLSDTAAYGAVIFGGAWFSRRRVQSNY